MPSRQRLRLLSSSVVIAAGLAGCDARDGRRAGSVADARSGIPRLSVCVDGEAPVSTPHGFDHLASSWLALLTPFHFADDAIAVVGEGGRVRAKLSYGSLSKDLEDEWVEVRVDDCEGATRHLGYARTDSDGRIALELEPDDLPEAGRYRLTLRVWGDDSRVDADLYVVPAGAPVVVFDIDGTLTRSDLELFTDLLVDLFEPIATGEYVPAAREGAADLTHLRATQGYLPMYLTGRPYWLTDRTRKWLAETGVAVGALALAPTHGDAWPTTSGVGDFKADRLAELELLGLDVVVAYGNATTDIYAYGEAGVGADATYIAGRHGGESKTIATGEGFAGHLEQIADEPPIAGALAWP